jgi:P27 family predicted phage terminase small subunit
MARRQAVALPSGADLAPRALDKFRALLPGLERTGRLEPGERDTLALYCQAWCDWVDAGEQVIEQGRFQRQRVGKRIKLVENPWFVTQREAARSMERLAQELRLTPSSRVAIIEDYPVAYLLDEVL